MKFFVGAFIFIVAISVVVGIPGYLIYWSYMNPCVQEETYETICGGDMYCAVWNMSSNSCMVWSHSPTYPCTATRCARRESRTDLEKQAETKQEFDRLQTEGIR